MHGPFGVGLATVSDLYTAEREIDAEKRAYARKFYGWLFGSESEPPPEADPPDWLEKPLVDLVKSPSSNQILYVDLTLPDRILLEEFEQLLQSERVIKVRDNLEKANKHKPDFSKWIRFGVLPYIDLRMWEIETGLNIPNRVMANAIFPEGEGGEEVVRKTTRRLANNLLSPQNLSVLAALSAQEIAEKNIV